MQIKLDSIILDLNIYCTLLTGICVTGDHVYGSACLIDAGSTHMVCWLNSTFICSVSL